MFVETIIGLFLALVLWLYITDGVDPLDKLPGLPALPIIGNAHQLMKIGSDELLQTVNEFTRIYGDRYSYRMMRYRILHLTRPSDIEVVMSHSKNISKGPVYGFLGEWLGNGLLLSTGDHWHKRRKVLTPAFHFNILKTFATVMEERGRELVNLLKEKKGADVDVMPVISDYTLFIICETAMGTKLYQDLYQSAATTEYKDAIKKIGQLFLYRVTKFWLWADFLYKYTSKGKEYFRALETVHSFPENVIKERKAHRKESEIDEVTGDEDVGTKRRLAMLDLLLEAEAKGEIDIAGIRDEVNTFMFEGHDTVAVAITFGLMLLADHEDIQERIFCEIQSILNSSDRSPSMSDLADMKYMEAVIKEILRLYPSVPLIGRQIEENFMLDDVLVKQGSIVGLQIFELHHREDMFPDAEAFKPERFLPGSELKHPFSYVPFSAGPRNCIGQRFAMQEMKITFCKIIRTFKLVPKVKGARPRLTSDLVLRPAEPIYIKFIPRK